MKKEFKAPTCAEDFPEGTHEIRHAEGDCEVIYVLLKGGKVAKVKEGTGEDVERATLIAGDNRAKYFTALMAGCVEIDGKPVVMEDLSALPTKSYQRIQVAYSEINF